MAGKASESLSMSVVEREDEFDPGAYMPPWVPKSKT
jgi:hypothetical protein